MTNNIKDLMKRARDNISILFDFSKKIDPTVLTFRNNRKQAAIIFVHGFTGSAADTWTTIRGRLENQSLLNEWDLFSISYASSLRVDIPNGWSKDPSITALANYLTTLTSLPPISAYQKIAVIAHSMGGLVVQKAIVDDISFRRKISHLCLFGTPSNGLQKASFVGSLKRQLRDMGEKSPFIVALRSDWLKLFAGSTPFALSVIAGDKDDFVSLKSSLGPFGLEISSIIRGNHLTMLTPDPSDVAAIELVTEVLCGGIHRKSIVESASLAIELGEFHASIEQLLPRQNELDPLAISRLALALESVGRQYEALVILQEHHDQKGNTSSGDALGILAGRLKRRWITERAEKDLLQSRELYLRGLAIAESSRDFEQASYHAINIAALGFLSQPPNSIGSKLCEDHALAALEFCEQFKLTAWNLATRAEAYLILGNASEALKYYGDSLKLFSSPREILSAYSQAILIAAKGNNEEIRRAITSVFEITSDRVINFIKEV